MPLGTIAKKNRVRPFPSLVVEMCRWRLYSMSDKNDNAHTCQHKVNTAP